MSIIDVTQVLKGMSGKPIKQPTEDSDEPVDFLVRNVLTNALLGVSPEEKIDGQEKARRYSLAVKIYEEDEVDLKAEDISLLKKLVGEAYQPLVVGQTYAILDPEDEVKAKEDKKDPTPRTITKRSKK